MSVKVQQKLSWGSNSLAKPEYIRDYVGINKGKYDIFTRAAKEYTVTSCAENIESLRYGIENKLISGKPYKMSDLYEQAIYTEKAFTAGVRWVFQYIKTVRKEKSWPLALAT